MKRLVELRDQKHFMSYSYLPFIGLNLSVVANTSNNIYGIVLCDKEQR